MLIREAFSLYREIEIVAGGLSNKTFETYVYAEKLAINFFGENKEIEDIEPMEVRNYYKNLMTWQKPDTARGNIVCLRAVFKLCVRKGITPKTYPADIKIPKREKRLIRYLTDSEVSEFIDVLAQKKRGYAEINRLRNIAIAEVLYSSGIRVGELCKLNKNSIRDRQFAVIGKSKDPRTCYISERAELAINAYLKKRTDSNSALFISNETEARITTGTVRRIFQNACNNSDFSNVHPHTLRHSFATTLLRNGIELIYISAMMGHESLETTKMYTHYENPKLRMEHDKVFA